MLSYYYITLSTKLQALICGIYSTYFWESVKYQIEQQIEHRKQDQVGQGDHVGCDVVIRVKADRDKARQ